MSGELIAALSTVAVLFAGCIVAVVKQRRNASPSLHDDVRDIRRNVHGIRDSLHAIVTKVAVLETRVTHLEKERDA